LEIFVFGQEVCEEGVELEFAFLDEHEDGGCSDGFGLRGDPEESVGLHGLFFRRVSEAVCRGVEEFGSGGGEGDGPVEFTVFDEALKAGGQGLPVAFEGGICEGRTGEREQEEEGCDGE
jgi:hypothetical protein